MKIFKNKINNNTKFILSIIFCILFTSLVMIFIYNSTGSRKDIRFINSIAKKITTNNSKLSKSLNGLTVDPKLSLSILQDNSNDLKNIRTDLMATVIDSSVLESSIPKLISCIDSTQNLYNYCINLLSSSNNLSSLEYKDNIEQLKNDCINTYKELSYLDVEISFSEESSKFFEDIVSYLTTLQKITIQQEIKDKQTKEFMDKLNTSINSFSTLLEDFEPAVSKIRADKRSFDVLLKDINKKEEDLKEIKLSFIHSSIPEGCLSYYNALSSIFDIHSTYLSTLKTAIIYEKSSPSYNANKKNIDKNYENAYSKYEDVKFSLDKLTESLKNF